jgi:hypothetical protein
VHLQQVFIEMIQRVLTNLAGNAAELVGLSNVREIGLLLRRDGLSDRQR